LLQLMPLDQMPTEDSLKGLINQLVDNNVFTKELASKLSIHLILNFFSTEFGEYLLEHHSVVRREQPFSLLIPAKELYQDYITKQHDTVLIHGIVDGFVLSDSEFVLYDFKTDYVVKNASTDDLEKIKQRYKGQLALYKLALEEIYQRKVTSTKLILLNSGDCLEME